MKVTKNVFKSVQTLTSVHMVAKLYMSYISEVAA